VSAGVPITVRRGGTLVEVCEACLERDAEDFGRCSTCIAGGFQDEDDVLEAECEAANLFNAAPTK
jgi:hypothetical protein